MSTPSRARVSVEVRGRSYRLRYRVGDGRPSISLPDERQARFAAELIERALAARPDHDPWPLVQPLVADYAGSLGAVRTAPVPAEAKRTLTVQEFYEIWLPTKKPPKCRKGNYLDHVRYAQYFMPHLGHLQLDKVTEDDVCQLRDHLLARGGRRGQQPLNPQTVRNVMSTVQRLLYDARKKKLMRTSPFGDLYRDWDLPRSARWQSKADPFTAAEERKLLDYLRTRYARRQPHLHGYVLFQAYIPCRPSEASGLMWTDMDLANRRAHIRRSWHKGVYDLTKTAHSDRWVVLPPQVVEVLRQLRDLLPLHAQPETPVFVNRDGKPIEPANFAPTWNACLRAAGVRARGQYALKDSAVTHLRLARCSWAFIEQQSGVAERTLRRHYAGQLPDEMLDEYDQLASWQAGMVGAGQPHPTQPQRKEALNY